MEERIFYDDIPKRFDKAIQEADEKAKEMVEVVQNLKKNVLALKKDYTKFAKLMDDWSWGRGKAKTMKDDEFYKIVKKMEEKLKAVGVIGPHDNMVT